MTNEEAIRRLKEGAPFSGLYVEEWEEALNMAIDALQARKEGKWEIKYSKHGVIFPICSNCDYVATNWVKTKYCPNCGAKMKEEKQHG